MMTPKLPPAAAFRLLSDLNEFFAVPQAERDKLLADYMNATEQKEAAAKVIATGLANADQDRLDASQTLHDAANKVGQLIHAAETKAAELIRFANEEANIIGATARETATAAALTVQTAQQDAEAAIAGLAERDLQSQVRLDEVEHRETAVGLAEVEAAETKATYQNLIDQFMDIRAKG